MKRLLFTIAAVLFTAMSIYAKDSVKDKDRSHSKWLVTLGYGYSYTSDKNAAGTGSANSIIYLPHRLWGFGLDLGMNQTEKISKIWESQESYANRHVVYSDWFVGPSVYLFPVNSKRHRIHLGVGGNIFDYNMTNIHNMGSYSENDEISISTDYTGMCNVGFHASAGYSFKFLKHLELGVRAYTSFYQEGFNLNALVNLSVSF